MKRFVLLKALFFLFAFWSTSGPVASQENKSLLPYRFLIPEGYVGYVRVDFEVPDAPALPVEDNYYILKFPRTGRLQTSSKRVEPETSIVTREVYYYFSDVDRYQLEINSQSSICMIQDRFSGPHPSQIIPKPYIYIFVGPREVYRKISSHFNPPPYELEEDGYPKVGARIWLTKEELERLKIKRL